MVGQSWRCGNEYKLFCLQVSVLCSDGRRVEGGDREGCLGVEADEGEK